MSRQRVKLFLSTIGLILTVAALKLQDPRITWVAIAVLAGAVLLRFTGGRPVPPAGGSGSETAL